MIFFSSFSLYFFIKKHIEKRKGEMETGERKRVRERENDAAAF
jgi:hypothetical protein